MNKRTCSDGCMGEQEPTMSREMELFRRKHWTHWTAAENLLVSHAVSRLQCAELATPVAAPAKQVEPVAPQAPSDDEWHREADRLRKCVEYAPTAGEAYTFRVQLGTHLHKKPLRPSAPPPVVRMTQMARDLAYYKNIAERCTDRALKNAGASGPLGDPEVTG